MHAQFCSSEHEVFAFLPAHHIFWSKQDEIKLLMFCLFSRGFYGLSTDQLSWRTASFTKRGLGQLQARSVSDQPPTLQASIGEGKGEEMKIVGIPFISRFSPSLFPLFAPANF